MIFQKQPLAPRGAVFLFCMTCVKDTIETKAKEFRLSLNIFLDYNKYGLYRYFLLTQWVFYAIIPMKLIGKE